MPQNRVGGENQAITLRTRRTSDPEAGRDVGFDAALKRCSTHVRAQNRGPLDEPPLSR